MEEDGGCCGAAGPHWGISTQALRQKETRLNRMAQFLAAGLLVLISVSVALFITVQHAGRSCRTPDRQPTVPPASSADIVEQQPHENFKNPCAMLTAPMDQNVRGRYLLWESKQGSAFCHGGFNYSNGNLVVPRSGVYRVFLQISYQSNGSSNCEELYTQVFVFRDTYKTDTCLLSLLDTMNCSTKPWNKSTYTAGLFVLEANCLLRVTSSHPDLISMKEHQVFFGAELLP